MKIAHINMFYLPTFGGVEQVMYELAKRQVKEGHEVHVFCCDSDKYKRLEVKEEVIEGVHVHRYPYWFRLSLSTFIWPSLLWKLPKYDFDVIHSHVSGHAYILIAGIVARKKNTIHVHTTHCPWTDAFRPKILKPFLFINDLFLNRLSFRLIDKIVSITPWELDTLKKWTNEKKIIVIPNGTDEILFNKIKVNNFKKDNKIKGKLVLFFGRLNPTKGPEKLAQAAVEISKERKGISFVWIGSDEGKAEEVKKIIEGHKNMQYLGPIRGKNKIAEMFQASDVYVLPSYREGLPLTLFEAYASGLPVIASPVNGIPYEMEDGVNGYFVNYGDIENLKKRILEVLDNKKLALKFSKNNIKKAKNYSWEIIAKRYEDLYKELIENQS
ncbi:glycosyltransferase family 4 protein [Candidatus Woesearchaeota archaeon]|nr:glycosyltransferase family 4 protein [Candidatus Woesearchaeota archaeon]